MNQKIPWCNLCNRFLNLYHFHDQGITEDIDYTTPYWVDIFKKQHEDVMARVEATLALNKKV